MTQVLETSVVARLDDGLAELDIRPDERQRERLLALLALLHKWNAAYNLTAVRTLDEMVVKHLLDSAAVLSAVTGPRLLDAGAGPGLPGLVLAILNPQLAVTLLDSNGKKVRFQRQAVMELALENVTPVQARVETFEAERFDQIISRAFASLVDFVTLTDHLLAVEGQWLAMKGPAVDDELIGLPDTIGVVERRVLTVPFEPGQRQLLILQRLDSQ
ncbi:MULTISPECIES: 16S rRNA (guanine(527)-N(7))-methyltransferase RsmG [Halomonadaceae]|uniref:16S rRNA (guanine(527)-N(7))-methyltransferase RsmG n=1 Tax=Halomonadaceae TaxID=28256 RepID=UPI001597740C|nr:MULTISPECIES: 16S rRNA (guanine(527)-N(7))-methyltransferase RsmG [Halomonas]QJQ95605.1 16S rRNA (guanine(527)-N(7))-methyltransferase RsmG [Halomonas sp. PA5]